MRTSRSHTSLGLALDALRTAIEDANAGITNDVLPRASAEEAQMAVVFQNLISNAIKYRRIGVALRIEVRNIRRGDGAVTICVSDNGIGFDPVYADNVFGLFKRLHTNEYPGTGLGLAICKRIVERRGGSIWSESEPGVGSKFYVTLPQPAVQP
jgi:signal transduction histidine kinase